MFKNAVQSIDVLLSGLIGAVLGAQLVSSPAPSSLGLIVAFSITICVAHTLTLTARSLAEKPLQPKWYAARFVALGMLAICGGCAVAVPGTYSYFFASGPWQDVQQPLLFSYIIYALAATITILLTPPEDG